VDSSQTSSLDIPQWLQSSGNLMPAEFLEREQPKDGFPIWMSGKEMSETLTHPNTPDEWIAFMQDSLVKTLALLENKQELLREPDQVFTEKSCELLAQLDPTNSTWKMSPQLSQTALNKLSKTWPSWGMTVDGCVYEHPMSGRRITAIDGSHWPTPTAKSSGAAPSEGRRKTPNLAWQVKNWPTPEEARLMGAGNGGKLNPTWVEWLMGWPIEYTVSKHLETVKSRSKRQSRTDYSKDDLPEWLRTC